MDGPPSLSTTVAPAGVSAPGLRGVLINAESSGQNVTNAQEGAEGFYQITGPTWHDFAPRAGVDLTQYPSAIKAPYEIQSKVADIIPMGRWGPRTQQILAGKFGQLDPTKPLGYYAQLHGGPAAPPPGSPINTTQMPVVPDPTGANALPPSMGDITAPAAAPAAAAPPAPTAALMGTGGGGSSLGSLITQLGQKYPRRIMAS
jgi:hypothetical protein